jgi:hypothetical protein
LASYGDDVKVTVGGRERIAEVSLTIPNGEDAWLEFAAGTWNVKLHIVFVDIEGEVAPSQTKVGLEGKGEYGVLTFTNWKSAEPITLEKPVKLGKSEGRQVVMMVRGEDLGAVKALNLSFFWEGPNV